MPSSDFTVWIRNARCLLWALSFSAVLLLVQSALWTDHVPWVLKVGVCAIAVLAALRPAEALLVVTGLVPFGHVLVTRVWTAYPFAASEAFVLAFLAGYLWQERRAMLAPLSPTDDLALPSTLFAAIVLASCVVQLAVLQVWHDYPLTYAVSFLQFLVTEYLTTVPDPRPWVDGRGFVWTAALLLEGVALLGCAAKLCTRQPGLARRLAIVAVAAGVGVVMLTFYGVIETAFERNNDLIRTIEMTRWSSPAIPSLDTVGPYFALVAFLAIGLAATSRRDLVPGLLAGAIAIGGVFISRTRSAIVASLAIVVSGLVFAAARRSRWPTSTRYLVAALVALTLAVGVVLYNPFHILVEGGGFSLRLRALFAETALRMMASAPLTGVGIGQYEGRYPEFAPAELLRYYAVNNAHNYFLWIGAELGLVGLGCFLWLFGVALTRGWSRLRSGQDGYWFLGVAAGLTSFIITWSIGQPLAVPQVSYTFWILLGLAAARATDDRRSAVKRLRPPLLARVALAVTMLLVLGSVPIRASRAIANIDLSRVSYGFYNSGTTEDNRSFRWAGPRTTFFVSSSVRTIQLPLAAALPAMPHGAQVDILVDGRAADRVVLTDRAWRTVRINAPVSAQRFWRLDLQIAPIDIPANIPPEERRIAVGEIDERRHEESEKP